MTTGATSCGGVFLEFLMLVLLGNVIGMALMVAVLSPAQVMFRTQRTVAASANSLG